MIEVLSECEMCEGGWKVAERGVEGITALEMSDFGGG